MDKASLETSLVDLHIPAVRFFTSIDSTNDEAWRWVDAGALSGSLVVANKQTAGRGRFMRRWITTKDSGLAFSLIIQSPLLDAQHINHLTGLGALATCNALRNRYGLLAQIKWPNDILINQCKVAGVLAETRWDGTKLHAAVVGIGINITPEAIDPENLPAAGLNYPATCVDAELGRQVDPLELLHHIVEEFFNWLPQLASPYFVQQWEEKLAYRDQWVELTIDPVAPTTLEAGSPARQAGKVIGLGPDGSLLLQDITGETIFARVGEIHLKPTPMAVSSQAPDRSGGKTYV